MSFFKLKVENFSEDSIIPTWLLYVLSFLIPLLVFGVVEGLFYRNLHDAHHTVLGMLTALAWTYFLTNVIKVCAGRFQLEKFG